MKTYDKNEDYIKDVIEDFKKEFSSFGTVDSRKLITIIALAAEDNQEVQDLVLQFCKETFIQIVQQNCKTHMILRTPYFKENKIDKSNYNNIYGYFMPNTYPSITEFYKTNNATDTVYINSIMDKMYHLNEESRECHHDFNN